VTLGAREVTRADPSLSPVLGRSRSRVLGLLQGAGGPFGVEDVAKQVGLHPNTSRCHLDALVVAGLAERTVEDRTRPGRPRALYTARPDSPRAGHRSYRILADILASYMAAQVPEPTTAGLQAGQVWGRYLAVRPPPFRRLDAVAATEQLIRTLDDIGFAPEAVTVEGKQQILLRHCPFLEIAAQHRDVVCAVHLGLMQGLLAELDAPVDTERIDRLVEPTLCIAHLGPRDEATSSKPHRSG
jgi:predicted ArsR family transcriptional regulator